MRALVWTAAEKRRDEEDTLEGTKEQSRIVDAGLEGGRVTLCLIRSVQWRY